MQKKTVRDEEVGGKRVLVRVDFNVPMDRNGKIETIPESGPASPRSPG